MSGDDLLNVVVNPDFRLKFRKIKKMAFLFELFEERERNSIIFDASGSDEKFVRRHRGIMITKRTHFTIGTSQVLDAVFRFTEQKNYF